MHLLVQHHDVTRMHNGAVPELYMCQCGLHAVLLSHIGTLMRLLAAVARCIAGLLLACQYLRGMILGNALARRLPSMLKLQGRFTI